MCKYLQIIDSYSKSVEIFIKLLEIYVHSGRKSKKKEFWENVYWTFLKFYLFQYLQKLVKLI